VDQLAEVAGGADPAGAVVEAEHPVQIGAAAGQFGFVGVRVLQEDGGSARSKAR
jgi:hypothetical protein